MSSNSATVFLVDDDPVIRRSVSTALQKRGLSVKTFESARHFLAAYEDEHAGCLVLDLRMRGMSGLELQRELALRGMKIPIIFITGHGDVPQSVEALKAGAIDFLEKPFRQEDLLDAIEAAFARDREQRRLDECRRSVADRAARLTKREREVMALLVSEDASGASSKGIAQALGISPRTVEHHRARIMEKMETGSLVELVRVAELLR